MFCDKYIPDIRSTSGGPIGETITLYLKSRKYPGGAVYTKGPYTINSSVEKVSTRLRGREFALRLESATSTGATPWRNGEIRMAIQADGKR